jgi:type IV pilus assembly protein PilB
VPGGAAISQLVMPVQTITNPTAAPSGAVPSRLGELLVRRAIITADQHAAAVREQQEHGGQFAAALVRLGFISEDDLTRHLHQEYRLPIIDPLAIEPSSAVLSIVPHAFARKHEILPVSLIGSSLTLATADPSNLVALNEIKFLTGCEVRIMLAPSHAIQKAINRFYNDAAKRYTDVLGRLNGEEIEVLHDDDSVDTEALERASEDAPLVQLVDAVMLDAVERRASDIHIEPLDRDIRIRFRIDGILREIMRPPLQFKNALASRIKIMAALDIAERRLPQDGAIKLRLPAGREVHLRVSSLPTIYGEKLVLRILDRSAPKLGLAHLGFEPEQLEQFQAAIRRPYGMVLVTGPTGSGKSTTLYSMLAEFDQSVLNIASAEDPVEIRLHGVTQVQIHDEIGLTFAAALRGFLRQDPDVIMVGEIRDSETAEIAFKAALTGHLVLSTLHTNDAPSSVNRLIDMGVEPFLVSSSLVLIAAQRLVRTICPMCKAPDDTYSREAFLQVGFTAEELEGLVVYRGSGCDECADTGYRGRIALYEVMVMDDTLRGMIVGKSSVGEIGSYAISRGMRPLRDAGRKKIVTGVTTIDEVVRVTGAE